MREVIPNALWLGNAIEARDVTRVLEVGVQAVIDLAMEEPVIQFPRDIVYCRLPLIDGTGNSAVVLRTAIETTQRFIESRTPTLVACSAGMSRSPAVVAAAIATLEQTPLVNALQKLTEGQPHDVSPGLLEEVAQVLSADCSSQAAIRSRLASVLRDLATEESSLLDELKANEQDLNRPDFVWHYLLQSFSTMGRAAGWHGLIGNQENYAKVTYEALSHLDGTKRLAVLDETLRAAKVRMPGQKAGWLAKNFDRIKRLGGPSESRRQVLEAPGQYGKLEFLMQFDGIGPKYARNIMMDVYHPEFRDSIAIDVRISGISKALSLDFSNYEEHEAFYLAVAEEAGLEGWDVDRLLFNFRDEVLKRLRVKSLMMAAMGSRRPAGI